MSSRGSPAPRAAARARRRSSPACRGAPAAAAAAVQLRRAREEQLQVVVELGHRADGRARGAHRVGLVDGDRRRDALDAVDLRLVHAVEELARVGREGLDVAALALGVERVEHERGLARAGHAGHDDELAGAAGRDRGRAGCSGGRRGCGCCRVATGTWTWGARGKTTGVVTLPRSVRIADTSHRTNPISPGGPKCGCYPP